jgi:hypothetical protein
MRSTRLTRASSWKGLLDEIHGAFFHGVDRHGHVAVAGDEHDGERRLALDQAVLQLQARHAAHADVDDQAGDFARVVAGEEGFGRVVAADPVVLAFEQPLQGVAHALVIINDVDGTFFGNQAHAKLSFVNFSKRRFLKVFNERRCPWLLWYR